MHFTITVMLKIALLQRIASAPNLTKIRIVSRAPAVRRR